MFDNDSYYGGKLTSEIWMVQRLLKNNNHKKIYNYPLFTGLLLSKSSYIENNIALVKHLSLDEDDFGSVLKDYKVQSSTTEVDSKFLEILPITTIAI